MPRFEPNVKGLLIAVRWGVSAVKGARLSAAMVMILMLLVGCTPNVQDMQEMQDAPGLIRTLGLGDDNQVRASAAAALGQIDTAEAVVPLLKAHSDQDAKVRAAAMDALPRLLNTLGTAEAVVTLLKTQNDQDAAVRTAAKDALTGLLNEWAGLQPEDTVAALTGALRDNRTQVRTAADSELQQYATALDRAFALEAMVSLLEAQGDQDAEVRSATTKALTALLNGLHAQKDNAWPNADGDKDVIAELIGDLGDTSAAVHNAACSELRQYFSSIGTDRAATAVAAAKMGDAWRAAPPGPGRELLASGTQTREIGRDDSSIYRAIHVVDGNLTPITAARSYEPSVGFHPAVALTLSVSAADGDGDAFLGVQDRWAPTALRFLELVVIVDNITREKLGVCSGYVDSSGAPAPEIIRYRLLRTVRVVFATNGELFAQRTFKGMDPRSCAAEDETHSRTALGEEPDLTQAIPWLESLIHPPRT